MKSINFETLFIEAEMFYNSAYYILNNYANVCADYNGAFIVNATFACELYMKFLLYANNKSPWGHELKYQLYVNLSPKIRTQLEIMVGIEARDYFLNNFNKGFENYRYYYENEKSLICKPVLRMDYINAFIIGLRSIALNEYNNLKG